MTQQTKSKTPLTEPPLNTSHNTSTEQVASFHISPLERELLRGMSSHIKTRIEAIHLTLSQDYNSIDKALQTQMQRFFADVVNLKRDYKTLKDQENEY